MAGRSLIDRIIRGPIVDDWHAHAACRDKPTSWWYAELKERQNPTPEARRALSVCFRCPVRIECLTHALTYPERYGIWSATTEHQRRRLLNRVRGGDVHPADAIGVALDIADETGARLGLTDRRTA